MEMASILRLQIEFWINLLFVTVMTGFLFYIFINSKRTRVLYFYCVLHALVILIFIADFASMIAPDIMVRWYCIAAVYIFKVFMDVLFVLYIRTSFKSGFKKILSLVLVLIYIAVCTLIIVTNSIHHLFIKEMTTYGSTYGILFYIILGSGCVIQMIGILLIMKYWIGRLDNPAYRIFASVLALVGILSLHLFLLKIVIMPVDIFPVLILAGFTVYFNGAYKYGMFDTISYGIKYGLEMYTDALLITDKKGKVLYKNKACASLEEKTLQDILGRFLQEPEHKTSKWRGYKADVEIAQADVTKYYLVSVKPVKPGLFPSGKTIFIIHDNTKIISAIERLTEKNLYLEEMNESIKMFSEDTRKLAVLSERNLLAKEIHDVMGHSLILALNTLEINKMLCGDRSAAVRRIEQAVNEITHSLNEIASSVNQESTVGDSVAGSPAGKPETARHSIHERLSILASRLSDTGIILEITAMDDLSCCHESVIKTVLRVCQESVTNAIKHGQASRITISIKMKSDMLELLIVDNGRGCPNYTKGTGLTGMEERVKALHGTISFCSFEDQEGFMVRVNIPVLPCNC